MIEMNAADDEAAMELIANFKFALDCQLATCNQVYLVDLGSAHGTFVDGPP